MLVVIFKTQQSTAPPTLLNSMNAAFDEIDVEPLFRRELLFAPFLAVLSSNNKTRLTVFS